MLLADDAVNLFRAVILHRGLARQIGNRDHPAEPGFGSILPRWHQPVRPVKGADHDLDLRTVDAAEAQRRAATRTEIALAKRGGAERRRLAAGPGEVAVFDLGKGGEWRARRLLAHPAMTAAGQNRFGRCRHVRSIRCQACCNIANASQPAKIKSLTPASRSAASCSA